MYSGPATGLWTSPNPFSAVPAGSLAVADNLVFTAPCVIEPRRGFRALATGPFGTSASRADVIAFYSSGVMLAYDLTKVSYNITIGDGFVAFEDTFVPNGTNRMRFENAARSVFFNPDSGVMVWDEVGQPSTLGGFGQPSFAGCPRGLNIVASNATGNGWQSSNTAVAYRFTICRKDAFGRIIEGPPSGRAVLKNQITTNVGGMSRVAGVVGVVSGGGLVAHGLTVGSVVTLTPGEANFAAGAKTVASVIDAFNFTYAEAGVGASNTVAQTWTITRSASLTCYLPITANTVTKPITTKNFLRVYRSEMTLAAADVPSDEMFQCYETAYLSAANISNGYLTFVDVAPESVLEVPLYTNPNTGDGSLTENARPPLMQDLCYWHDRMWGANVTAKHSVELTLVGCGAPDGLQSGDTITIVPLDTLQTTLVMHGLNNPMVPGDFQTTTGLDPGLNIELTARAFCQAVNQMASTPVYAFYVSSESGAPGKIHIEAVDYKTFTQHGEFTVYSSRATAWTPQLPTLATPAFAALASTNNRHAARLVYSKLGQPEAFPPLNFEQIDADNNAILRVCALNYRLFIWKTDGLYFVPNTFPISMQKLSDHRLIAPDSVQRLGDAIYFLSDQGLMMVDHSGVRPVSTPIDATLTDLSTPASSVALGTRALAIAYRSDRQYMLWTPERDALDNVSDDNAQAFVYSTLSNGFTRFTFGIRAGGVCPPNMPFGGSDQLLVAPTNANYLWLERKDRIATDYRDPGEVAISTRLEFNILTDAAPATMKLNQECSFLFTKNAVSTITATFASEIHPTRAEVAIFNPGWGGFAWGEEPWGGYVRTIRRVAPLPVDIANCCQLSVGFSASVLGVKFAFVGIDINSNGDTIANRG